MLLFPAYRDYLAKALHLPPLECDHVAWEKFWQGEDNLTLYRGLPGICAELWGMLMQADMANGKTLAESYEETSVQLSKNFGMSGGQFATTQNFLRVAWRHREELEAVLEERVQRLHSR